LDEIIKKIKNSSDLRQKARRFAGEIFVVKYGGAAWEEKPLRKKFAQDLAFLRSLGINLAVIHGGGKSISKLTQDLGIKTEFKNGLRVTNERSLLVAQMVLKGSVGSEIVRLLSEQKCKAIGISGIDAGFVKAKMLSKDLGLVGKITQIEPKILEDFFALGIIPVISPIASCKDKKEIGFNINADTFASEIAKALNAKKVFFLTDTSGVLDENKKVLEHLDERKTQDLIKCGIIFGGMLPKVEACLDLINCGIEEVHIIDGRCEHSVLYQLFDKKRGTTFSKPFLV